MESRPVWWNLVPVVMAVDSRPSWWILVGGGGMPRGLPPPVGGFGASSADDDDAGHFRLRVPRVHLLLELPESQQDGASFMWSPGECGVSPEMGPGLDAKAPTGKTSASGPRILFSKPVRISVVRMRESDSRGFGGGAPAPPGWGRLQGPAAQGFCAGAA